MEIDSVSNDSPTDSKFETFLLERTSTPNSINLCEHCKHSHARECCLYVYDDLSDILKYSTFKHNVEEPYYIVDNDENFHMKIGKSTPKHFPTFTENDSSVADMKMLGGVPGHPPIVYFRQFLWPVYMPPYQPHLVRDQFVYHSQNYVYYPQITIPTPMPQTHFIPTVPIKPVPAVNPQYQHYCNNYVPNNYNNYWV